MINIKKIVFVTALAIMSCSFIGCNNTYDDNINNQSNILVNKKYVNYRNPFNQFGEYHNNLLSSIGYAIKDTLQVFANKGQVTSDDMQVLIGCVINVSSEILANNINYSADTITIATYDAIDRLKVENSELNTLIKSAIVRARNNEDSLFNNIIDIENKLLVRYLNGDSNAISDLKNITILKYSMMYWSDAIHNINNPWHSFVLSAYINHNIYYVNNKSLVGDALHSLCNFVSSAVSWIGTNLGNVVGSIVVGASVDYSVGCYFIPYSTGAGTVIGGPVGSSIGLGFGIGVTAISSAIGGIAGWYCIN